MSTSRKNHRNRAKASLLRSHTKVKERLAQKLVTLKEEGRLTLSLESGASEFEVFEFYGDAFMEYRISKMILGSRSFMDPHLMTALRISVVKNTNLEEVFHQLEVQKLLKTPRKSLKSKQKADVIESIIGELALKDENDLALGELLGYIHYNGEKNFFKLQRSGDFPSPPPTPQPSVPQPTQTLKRKRPGSPSPSSPSPSPSDDEPQSKRARRSPPDAPAASNSAVIVIDADSVSAAPDSPPRKQEAALTKTQPVQNKCWDCMRTFKTAQGLQSHSKAKKHFRTAPPPEPEPFEI